MSTGSDDPADQQPAASPSPGNPFSPTPSTTPISTASPTPAQSTPGVDPPKEFVAAVNNALMFRLGQTKYGLIPAADKKALIAKIWADPSIQNYWTQNSGRLNDPNVAGTLGVQINNVMLGQGNDPTTAVDYTNMLQAAGVPLTTSEQAALAGATQAVNAPVPRPFNEQTVSGYDYGAPMPAGGWSPKAPGQSFGWDKHYGVDYGTRVGERIVSPFAGTVTVEQNVPGYGNAVIVTLDNGWKMTFGHVQVGEIQNGARVNPGDLIALGGQNIGDSTGSVTVVTWQDPTGGYQNPHDVLDPIFSGATFSSIGASGAAGQGYPTVNKALDTEYPSIKSDWQTYFGSPPSPEDVMMVLQHGSSPAQWSDFIRALPSHIDGLTQGQYYDMRQVADSVSTTVLGHPSTDSIVQELSGQGLTSKQAVTNWYNEHGVTGIPDETYQQIYKAAQPINANIFNEPAGADPRDIKNIHDTHQRSDQVGFTPQ